MADHAKLTIDKVKPAIELPIYHGTLGPEVMDVTQVGKSGAFTYDPGFMSTAACSSKITYIDGDKGILLYRGYPIEQLAEKSDFLEVCYLLLRGELPTAAEKEALTKSVHNHSLVQEQIHQLFNGFPRDAHPMAMMLSAVGALSGFYPEFTLRNIEHQNLAAINLIAKIPTLAAMCYKYSHNQAFVHPQNQLGYAENFLHMMMSNPNEDLPVSPVLARAMDRIFILHADHEQNASTSTVRLAGSTGANPYACIAAGIAALWGPAHGGANEACLNMLREIGDVANIDKYIARAKDPNDAFRLMGFGHRVYKNFDPRVAIMRETCHEILEEVGAADSPLFKIALALEKIALEDEYFISRKLYPNVDFYSGITLSALGIPTNMFTVIFALARTVGWISQWQEMINDPEHKIGRPRQLYLGSTKRDFVSLDQR